MRPENDAHHILHTAREWRLRPEGIALREHPSLIPRISRDSHEALHRACPPVPLLGYHALRRIVSLWTPDIDTMKSMDNLLFAIEEASWDPRSHPLESKLAELVMQGVDVQRPFIREGLIERRAAA